MDLDNGTPIMVFECMCVCVMRILPASGLFRVKHKLHVVNINENGDIFVCVFGSLCASFI